MGCLTASHFGETISYGFGPLAEVRVSVGLAGGSVRSSETEWNSGWDQSPLLRLVDRVGAGGVLAFRDQVERSGFCSHPVRLRGGAAAVDTGTGEVRAAYSTDGQPDGTLLIAC